MEFTEVKCFTDTGQHAQCQHSYFEKIQCFYVIFVPLNIRAVRHAGINDRAQVG